jgi:putative nucleotidyltransferase with HDIG domain
MNKFSLLPFYRLLDSDKPVGEFLENMVELLQDNFKGTAWDIGYVVESTAQLIFPKSDTIFTDLKIMAEKALEDKAPALYKENVPSGYKWLYVIPMIYKRQKLGVLMCLGKGKKDKGFDNIGEDIGFVIQQYQLKQKLVKDTILMHTLIMSSQSTATSTEITPILQLLIPHLKRYLMADAVRLFMWEKDGTSYYDETCVKNGIEISEGMSIVQEVQHYGRPLMMTDAHEYANFNPEIDAITDDKKILNLIAAPIKVENEVKSVLLAVNNNPESNFVGSDLVWVKSVCGEIGATLEKIKLYRDIHKLFLASVEALAAAIEGKDPYTHGHSRRVTMYSMIIGKELGLDKDLLEDIRLSGLLHDIGKIAIPEAILLKPGKLTDEEWLSLREHPQKGANMIAHVGEFNKLVPGIKHHHEHYNGKGYPAGLKGDEIPLIARIISVADAFDAMTSKRIYRDALNETEALKEIKRCKGTQFDPQIADVFLNVYKEKFYSGN